MRTFLRALSVALIPTIFMLSSCLVGPDDDIQFEGGPPGGTNTGSSGGTDQNGPSIMLTLDSMVVDSTSVNFVPRLHYGYDSIVRIVSATAVIDRLIFQPNEGWHYSDSARTLTWSLDDTVDFVTQTDHDYRFVLPIDSLQALSYYELIRPLRLTFITNGRQSTLEDTGPARSFQTK